MLEQFNPSTVYRKVISFFLKPVDTHKFMGYHRHVFLFRKFGKEEGDIYMSGQLVFKVKIISRRNIGKTIM